MIITDPTIEVTNLCRTCGREFSAPKYYGKLYCSQLCKRRAKNFRAKGAQIADQALVSLQKDQRFCKFILDPTESQLNACEEMIMRNLSDNKPFGFAMVKIMWQPHHKEITFNLQPKLRPTDLDIWLMDKAALDLSTFLK